MSYRRSTTSIPTASRLLFTAIPFVHFRTARILVTVDLQSFRFRVKRTRLPSCFLASWRHVASITAFGEQFFLFNYLKHGPCMRHSLSLSVLNSTVVGAESIVNLSTSLNEIGNPSTDCWLSDNPARERRAFPGKRPVLLHSLTRRVARVTELHWFDNLASQIQIVA